jgi:aminoglycoside phosphotransferase (APT) family kinase protein
MALHPVRPEDAFDVHAVHAWLAAVATDLPADPPEVQQYGGGASNLTYLLTYPDRDLVLRRPPHGTKAASAHDMGREVLVQRSLRPYLDAVADIVGHCTDPAVIGAEFYVMSRLDGVILGRRLPEGMELDEQQARALASTVFDTLADLHSIDVVGAGLEGLGRGPGYVGRQVDGWSSRYRAALTADVPDGADVMAWLAERRPDDVAARLIHGDWKLDNLVLDLVGTPRVTGILDWEMATVGDPLMDLGASMAYWITADDDELFQLLRRQPSHLPGMPSRDELVQRYLARTGLDVQDWRFYEVFGLFRLAVIIQQIWARYRAGQTSNPAFAQFGGAVGILLARCSDVVRRTT